MNVLEEIEAIKRLKARYFRLMDTKQWSDFGDLFTADATLAASSNPDQIFTGRNDIVRRVSAALREATTVHHGHMPEIELTGEGTATGVWAMYDFVDLPQLVLHGWGHYHEEYVKQGDVWRIRRSSLTRLRLDVTPK